MTIYIPTHMDSGNRGCEAIFRGTQKILNTSTIIAYSSNVELDITLGLDASFIKRRNNFSTFEKLVFKLRRLTKKTNKEKKYVSIKEHAAFFLEDFCDSEENVILSTGGDEFCYDDNWVVYLGEYLNCHRSKFILWGCSVGKDNLSESKVAALKSFDCIVARESLTESVLKTIVGLKNVYCYPDPGFTLDATEVDVSFIEWDRGVVGINLSNFVSADVGEHTLFRQNIYSLFDYILTELNMDILLIPHVFWKDQDDRKICGEIYTKYSSSHRVSILHSETLNYEQIRYVIGKCSFFVGARTHAMISAYSMCVPSIALGYSIKAQGIAKDLGLSMKLLVDYRCLQEKDEIKEAFIYMVENESSIRNHLKQVIPTIREKALMAGSVIGKTNRENNYDSN